VANLLNQWFREDGRVGGPAYVDDNLQRIREEELRAAHKTQYGKHALILELVGHCFFRETQTEEEVVLCNMAKRKLAMMGIWLPGNEEKIVEALLRIASPIKGEIDD